MQLKKGELIMETTIQQLLDSSLRSEILELFGKARTKRQLIFAFDSLLEADLKNGIEYFVQMMRRTHQSDDELIQTIEEKYSAYRKRNNSTNN